MNSASSKEVITPILTSIGPSVAQDGHYVSDGDDS